MCTSTPGDFFSHLLRKCQLPQRGSLIAAGPPKAFPHGGPNARENVQWTFSSEDGPVRPMGGGSPQG